MHAVLQQNPSTQRPLAQSVPAAHATPFGSAHVPFDGATLHALSPVHEAGAQQTPSVHEIPPEQSLFVVQGEPLLPTEMHDFESKSHRNPVAHSEFDAHDVRHDDDVRVYTPESIVVADAHAPTPSQNFVGCKLDPHRAVGRHRRAMAEAAVSQRRRADRLAVGHVHEVDRNQVPRASRGTILAYFREFDQRARRSWIAVASAMSAMATAAPRGEMRTMRETPRLR